MLFGSAKPLLISTAKKNLASMHTLLKINQILMHKGIRMQMITFYRSLLASSEATVSMQPYTKGENVHRKMF